MKAKYKLKTEEVEIDFIWEEDNGDFILSYSTKNIKGLWGMIFSYMENDYAVVSKNDGTLLYSDKKNGLREAQLAAENFCAYDILCWNAEAIRLE